MFGGRSNGTRYMFADVLNILHDMFVIFFFQKSGLFVSSLWNNADHVFSRLSMFLWIIIVVQLLLLLWVFSSSSLYHLPSEAREHQRRLICQNQPRNILYKHIEINSQHRFMITIEPEPSWISNIYSTYKKDKQFWSPKTTNHSDRGPPFRRARLAAWEGHMVHYRSCGGLLDQWGRADA